MKKISALRHLIKLVGDSITDDEFFASKEFAQALSGLAELVSQRFGVSRLSVEVSRDGVDQAVAYTDNTLVHINLDTDLVCGGREARYSGYIGLLGHELGHVLFTDFKRGEEIYIALENHNWAIRPRVFSETGRKYLAEMESVIFAPDFPAQALYNLIHSFQNILEDLYVNEQMSITFPGSIKRGIEQVVKKMWGDGSYQMPPKEAFTMATLSVISNTFYYACVYGFDKLPDVIQKKFPEIKEMGVLSKDIKTTENSDERYAIALGCMVLSWPYIKDVIKDAQQQQGQGQGQRQNSNSIGKNITDSVGSQKDSSVGSGRGLLNKNNESNEQSDNNGNNGNNDNNGSDNDSEASEVAENGKQNSGSGKNGNNRTNQNTNVLHTGGNSSDDEVSAETIGEILAKIVTGKIRKEHDSAESIARKVIADEISKGKCHCNYKITRDAPSLMYKNEYDKIFSDLRGYSRRIAQKLLTIIQSDDGSMMSGLMCGQKIDSCSVARGDGKVFKSRRLPDENSLAVSLLIDQSGSMSGKRIQAATKAAMIIEDFCSQLNIPLSVVGHNYSSVVNIYQYIDFDDVSVNRKYSLCKIFAGSCNHDGFAFRYCVKRLAERDEETKLFILLSDGAPNADGYCGSFAEKDLQQQVLGCKKQQITFFAGALGEDREQIRPIYGDSYLDISDLSRLPQQLLLLVKKHVKI